MATFLRMAKTTSSSSLGKSVVLKEKIDPRHQPSLDEIRDYARWLGMDLERDADLLWIARQGLMAPLPSDWRACQAPPAEGEEEGDIYYFNFTTGESRWDHPMDDHFRDLYTSEKQRKEAATAAAAAALMSATRELRSTTTRSSSSAASLPQAVGTTTAVAVPPPPTTAAAAAPAAMTATAPAADANGSGGSSSSSSRKASSRPASPRPNKATLARMQRARQRRMQLEAAEGKEVPGMSLTLSRLAGGATAAGEPGGAPPIIPLAPSTIAHTGATVAPTSSQQQQQHHQPKPLSPAVAAILARSPTRAGSLSISSRELGLSSSSASSSASLSSSSLLPAKSAFFQTAKDGAAAATTGIDLDASSSIAGSVNPLALITPAPGARRDLHFASSLSLAGVAGLTARPDELAQSLSQSQSQNRRRADSGLYASASVAALLRTQGPTDDDEEEEGQQQQQQQHHRRQSTGKSVGASRPGAVGGLTLRDTRELGSSGAEAGEEARAAAPAAKPGAAAAGKPLPEATIRHLTARVAELRGSLRAYQAERADAEERFTAEKRAMEADWTRRLSQSQALAEANAAGELLRQARLANRRLHSEAETLATELDGLKAGRDRLRRALRAAQAAVGVPADRGQQQEQGGEEKELPTDTQEQAEAAAAELVAQLEQLRAAVAEAEAALSMARAEAAAQGIAQEAALLDARERNEYLLSENRRLVALWDEEQEARRREQEQGQGQPDEEGEKEARWKAVMLREVERARQEVARLVLEKQALVGDQERLRSDKARADKQLRELRKKQQLQEFLAEASPVASPPPTSPRSAGTGARSPSMVLSPLTALNLRLASKQRQRHEAGAAVAEEALLRLRNQQLEAALRERDRLLALFTSKMPLDESEDERSEEEAEDDNGQGLVPRQNSDATYHSASSGVVEEAGEVEDVAAHGP